MSSTVADRAGRQKHSIRVGREYRIERRKQSSRLSKGRRLEQHSVYRANL